MPPGVYLHAFSPVADRFWPKVDKNGPLPANQPELGPCWIYTGSRSRRGYGHLHMEGRDRMATHVALALDGRPVEPGMWALHHCDNGSGGCVRPSHLYPGTAADNSRDMRVRGRAVNGTTAQRRVQP